MMTPAYGVGVRMRLAAAASNLARSLQHAECQLTLRKLFTMLDKGAFVWYIVSMRSKNLPIAEIVSIRATAEEAKKLDASLLAKTTIVKEALERSREVPSGPILINGQWW